MLCPICVILSVFVTVKSGLPDSDQRLPLIRNGREGQKVGLNNLQVVNSLPSWRKTDQFFIPLSRMIHIVIDCHFHEVIAKPIRITPVLGFTPNFVVIGG